MKHVFAAVLVLLALVTVFHAEKLVPIPRAMGSIMNSAVAKHMPFGIQTAYAESCISGLEGDQDRVRYAVSDAAVRLRALDARVATIGGERDRSTVRIKTMVEQADQVSEEAVAREVARHDDLQWKLTHARQTRERLGDTLASLESAEGNVTHKLTQLNDRLEIVQIDHENNSAQELAAELTDNAYPGKRTQADHCSKVIEHMEHKERVREELHRRYAPEPIGAFQQESADPWERARQIANGDC